MAPNFKKVKVFGGRKSVQPVPLSMEDPDQRDLEAGSFLNETQRGATGLGGSSQGTLNQSHHQGDNPYLDEYRA
jgi:hypothetical protein